MRIIKEICIESHARIDELIVKKADRIELCENLTCAGTSVSYGVAKHVIERCKKNFDHDIKVMCILRPRAGDFIYSHDEIKIMLEDMKIYHSLGAYGVVFGCLTKKNQLDEEATKTLVDLAKTLKLKTTFHMAFDLISPSDCFKTIDWLCKNGVDRLLTHGGQQKSRIEDNCQTIKDYINYAQNAIIILPGGGITTENFETIATKTGAKELHGTRLL